MPGGTADAAAARAARCIDRAVADITEFYGAADRSELDEQARRAAIAPGAWLSGQAWMPGLLDRDTSVRSS